MRNVRAALDTQVHDSVSAFGKGGKDGEVGQSAGDGTKVGKVRLEMLLEGCGGHVLDLVDVLKSLVITAKGQSLGVAMHEVRDIVFLAVRRHDVFRSYEVDAFLSPGIMFLQKLDDFFHLFGYDYYLLYVILRYPEGSRYFAGYNGILHSAEFILAKAGAPFRMTAISIPLSNPPIS